MVKGVKVVKADLDVLESLKTAVKGSYGVFGVTNCTCLPSFPSSSLTDVSVTFL